MSQHCSQCTLAADYCICRHVTQHQPSVTFALLLHANEPQRLTNTAPLIEQTVASSMRFIWQRKQPPEQLLKMINSPDYQPWLIFPADRPELEARSSPWQPAIAPKKPLFILPDGTWKEVRKMVRQSPWLDDIPILAFDPSEPTRYTLRRNPDADHLCTAEVASQLLNLSGHPEAAASLDHLLDKFLQHYHQWQHHLPPPSEGTCE